jgi:hypothetical protein
MSAILRRPLALCAALISYTVSAGPPSPTTQATSSASFSDGAGRTRYAELSETLPAKNGCRRTNGTHFKPQLSGS